MPKKVALCGATTPKKSNNAQDHHNENREIPKLFGTRGNHNVVVHLKRRAKNAGFDFFGFNFAFA